jgi:signal transduction histidine kinase
MRHRLLASTRARVLLGALALLAGTIALSVIANRILLLNRLDDRIDEDLAQEVGEFQRLAVEGIDPATGEPFGADIRAIFDTFFARNVPSADEEFLGLVGARPYLRSANAPFPLDEQADLVAVWAGAARPTYGSGTTPGGEVRWLVVPVAGAGDERLGTFVVARFPASERAEVDDAVRTAATVGFVAFLAAAFAAWAIAGRVLAPLRHLAAATESVREDQLDHRIPVEGTGELAELSRTFNEMLDRVEGAFAAQRAFLDDAGHELRTPITVIRGHLELTDPEAPLAEGTREIVFDELDRMARIVDDLLVIAKAERPDFVVPAPVDVADLTRDIVDKATPLADRRWEARPAAVVVADLDRERLTQAWMNLARNAVQHTAPGDRITVFSSSVGGNLELGVVDTGEGVAPEDRERIFDRFGRGGSARRTRADGAGLGLAIASAIAAAHGGRVELRDTPGGGATFVLVLPLTETVEEPTWPAS